MKSIVKYLVTAIFCTLVCPRAYSDNVSSAIDLSRQGIDKIIKRRLKEKDIYIGVDSKSNLEKGRLLSWLSQEDGFYTLSEYEIIADFSTQAKYAFLRTKKYSDKYPYNFISENYVLRKGSLLESHYPETINTRTVSYDNEIKKWILTDGVATNVIKTPIQMNPLSLSKELSGEVASFQSTQGFSDGPVLKPEKLSEIFNNANSTHDADSRIIDEYERMNDRRNPSYQDARIIEFNKPLPKLDDKGGRIDSGEELKWVYVRSDNTEDADFYDLFNRYFKNGKAWRSDRDEVLDLKNAPNKGTHSSPQTITRAEYEVALSKKFGKLEEVKVYNEDRELELLVWSQIDKKEIHGQKFIVSETFSSSLGQDKGRVLIARSREQVFYSIDYPYPLIRRVLHTENFDPITKVVVSTQEKELLNQGSDWIQTIKNSNSEKIDVTKLNFREHPKLINDVAFAAWLSSEKRSLGDVIHYESIDLDDASFVPNAVRVIKRGVELKEGKTINTDLTLSGHSKSIDFHEYIDSFHPFHASGRVSSGALFESGVLGLDFNLNKFQGFESELLESKDAKLYFDRSKRFKDGVFTFLATLSDKTKTIPESPDQIVSVVDKEKGILRITLGHGINKNYQLTGNDSLVTGEDSHIPDKWLSDIRSSVGIKSNQTKLVNATLKFLNANLTLNKDYGNGQSVQQIVKDMQGKCEQFAKLTAAILRRLGIRAQLVGGYSNPDLFGGDDGPHAVVEAVVDGKAILFEPQYSELKPLQNPMNLFFKLNVNAPSIDDTFISNLRFENNELPKAQDRNPKELGNEHPIQRDEN